MIKNNVHLNYKSNTFLVAGGTGFVGNALIKKLLKNGAKVRATYFSSEPKISDDNLDWVYADLTLMKYCKKVLENIDIVIIAAAVTSGAKDIVNNPLMHVTPNILINSQLLACSYNALVKKVLFISSAAAYPNLGKVLEENDMMKNDPENVYFAAGWMKRYSEILCYTYAKKILNPMSTIVVRPTNIYGPGDKIDWDKSHVTAATIRKVVERHNPIKVWGDGQDVRDLIYIDDFVSGSLQALEYCKDFFSVNIGSGKSYTINQILNLTIKIDDFKNPKIKYLKDAPKTSKSVQISIKKAKKLLKFKPNVNLQSGIKKTISWMKKEISQHNT